MALCKSNLGIYTNNAYLVNKIKDIQRQKGITIEIYDVMLKVPNYDIINDEPLASKRLD